MVGRKRSESSKQAIFKATLEALKSEGYESVSIESIAREAKVGKKTIYRWWPSKGKLVLEALREDARENISEQQSEDEAENLECFLLATFRRLVEPAGSANIVRWLMAQAQLEPDFRNDFRDEFIAARRDALRRILCRLVPDGTSDEQLELLIDILFGVMWYRLLVGHGELDEQLAARLTQLVVNQVRAQQRDSEPQPECSPQKGANP